MNRTTPRYTLPRNAACGVLALAALAATGSVAAAQGLMGGLNDAFLRSAPRIHVVPGLVWADDAVRHRLDADVLWALDPSFGSDAELTLRLGHARATRRTYSWSGVSARTGMAVRGSRAWAGASLAAGTGAGPRTVISIEAGGSEGMLAFEVRTTWFFQDASVDTLPANPLGAGSANAYRDGRHADAVVRLSRAVGPVDASLQAGSRFGGLKDDTPQWIFGEAAIPLWRAVGLRVSGGWRPARPEYAQPAGRFAALAVELRSPSGRAPPPATPPPAPPDPDGRTGVLVVALDDSRYRVRFLLPGAQRVEMHADVTDWTTVSLSRAADHPDAWETEFRAPPGACHIRLRVDGGAWFVPPGLVTVPDGFGGTAGILLLPAT